jgi:hypothetical protein
MHDDFHVIRTFEMNKCFEDWQFPCRWVPDMGLGYGYPEFNYYAPLPYYVMEVFYLLGASFLDSSKIFIVLVTIIGAWGMYLLSSYVWKSRVGGYVSSFLYTYLPYRAVDLYVRGALPELAAMAIIPFVFLFSIKVRDGVSKAKIYLGISLAFLFLTHTISIVIVTPFLLFWILFLFISRKENRLKVAIDMFVGFALGIGLAAFFLLPAWFEKSFVHIDTLTSGYFNYLAHFVSLRQLLFSYHWGYGVSELGVQDDISLSVGISQWVAATIVVLLVITTQKLKKISTVLLLFLLGWISLFLVHERATFIWKSIPTLAFIQFPWRILILPGFFFSVVAGAIGITSKKPLKYSFLAVVLVTTFLLYQSFFQPKENIPTTDAEKLTGDSWTRQISASIYDYLPISAQKAPDSEAPPVPIFLHGNGVVLSGSKKSDTQNWKIDVVSDLAYVELPSYYFPSWVVTINQKDVPIDYANEHGLMRVELPKGTHDISLKLEDTPIRAVSNSITIISLICLLILFII